MAHLDEDAYDPHACPDGNLAFEHGREHEYALFDVDVGKLPPATSSAIVLYSSLEHQRLVLFFRHPEAEVLREALGVSRRGLVEVSCQHAAQLCQVAVEHDLLIMHGVDHVADLGIYDTKVESSLLDIFTRELGNSYVSIVP